MPGSQQWLSFLPIPSGLVSPKVSRVFFILQMCALGIQLFWDLRKKLCWSLSSSVSPWEGSVLSHRSLVHVMVFARGRGVTPCPCHPGWLLPAPDTQAVAETTSGIVPAAKQHPGIKREVLNATAHILSQFLPLQLGVVDRRSRSSKVPNPLASVLTAPSQPRGVLQPGSTPALGGPAWWPCRPGHGAGEVGGR